MNTRVRIFGNRRVGRKVKYRRLNVVHLSARQASAERENRATITKAEGDKEAAVNLADAARTMIQRPGAMQLRTLQTIDGLGPTASNTVVLAASRYSGRHQRGSRRINP